MDKMKKDIYKLALRCKRISDESIGTDKNLIYWCPLKMNNR